MRMTIQWPRIRALLALSGPVALTLILQNAMGVASTAVVGRLGDAALAGNGVAATLVGIVMALLYGLDAAVQATAARRTGAGEPAWATQALSDALWIGALGGLALTILAEVAVPPLLGPALHNAAAAREGAVFVAGYAPILLALGCNITFAAYWNGVGLPHRATVVYLVQLPLHALLVWALTLGKLGAPALGMFGAGLGATLSAFTSTALHTAMIWSRPKPATGWLRPPAPSRLGPLTRIGAPVSLQQSLMYVCFSVYYVLIARIGVRAAAAVDVTSTIIGLYTVAAVGAGVAAATKVGGALGRDDGNDARAWGRQSAALGVAVLGPLSLPLIFAPHWALGFFITSPQTIAAAAPLLQITAASIAFDTVRQILSSAMRGAGYTATPAAVAFVLQWLIQTPLAWWIGLKLGYGLPGVAWVLFARTLIETAITGWLWRRGAWLTKAPPALPSPLRRIAILGGGGAGKSTLARKLGERLSLPVIHLDRLVFDPGWTRVSSDELRRRLKAQLGDAWIVEGTYRAAAELTHPSADLILWLEAPAWLRVLRSWRKVQTHRGRPRADRPDGCEEGFDWTYLTTILTFGRWNAAMARQIERLAPEAPLLRLSAKAAEHLLAPQPPLDLSRKRERGLPAPAPGTTVPV